MLQGGAQFIVKVLCILQAGYFKDLGNENNTLSLDGSSRVNYWQIILVVSIFSFLKQSI